MKINLTCFLILAFFFVSFANEKYGVYDLQGNRISTFEAEPHELSEKTLHIKSNNLHKKLYVSSLKKGKGSKGYRYRFKTGSYIEATRNETFSICPPDDKTDGTWISEHSVSLNAENCVSIKTPDLAGTLRILFMENNGHTDTIQVLVEQSYIQMSDYSHIIWVSAPEAVAAANIGNYAYYWINQGQYESRSYLQPIIVDKTKLTMADTKYYSEIGDIKPLFTEYNLKFYPENEKFDESKLPYAQIGIGAGSFQWDYASNLWRLANERSKKEGLDTAYHIISDYEDIKNMIRLDGYGFTGVALDTSASGYRLPFYDEWFFLMRAGSSTRYYWGDEEDSIAVSRYAWVKPIGLKSVAQLIPNKFGLYDMIGNAYEVVHYDNNNGGYNSIASCGDMLIPECIFIYKIRAIKLNVPIDYTGLRLIRKTPKLHKLEKF